MAKLTLNDLAGDPTSAAINVNSALIETALENTLSRDGTSPNAMGANLDMNSFRILNLPTPTEDTDAATKAYADGLSVGITPVYSTYTWATRPAISNAIIKISDVGTNGTLHISNGTRWVPLSGNVLLGSLSAPVSVGATVAESTVLTVPLPAGYLEAGSTITFSSHTDAANTATTKTVRLYYGGSLVTSYTANSVTSAVTEAWWRCLTSSTQSRGSFGGNNSSLVSSTSASTSIDTNALSTLTVTVQKGTANGDLFQLNTARIYLNMV